MIGEPFDQRRRLIVGFADAMAEKVDARPDMVRAPVYVTKSYCDPGGHRAIDFTKVAH